MLDPAVGTIIVDRSAGVARVFVHEYVLGDILAGAFGHFPHLVVVLDEGFVLGDRRAFGDEPGHVIHFVLAVVFVPEGAALSVPRAVIFAHDFSAVVLPRAPGLYFDSFCCRRELGEPLHERATHDGCPAIGWLHDFDTGVDGGADGFAEIGILAKAANHEDGVDFLAGSGDLAADEGDDFLDDRLEDLGDFSAGHAEFAAADALVGVVC